jgi:hypothetical protein
MKPLTDAQVRAAKEIDREWWRYDGRFYPVAGGTARRDVVQRLVNARIAVVGPRVHRYSPACLVRLTDSGHAALQEARG